MMFHLDAYKGEFTEMPRKQCPKCGRNLRLALPGKTRSYICVDCREEFYNIDNCLKTKEECCGK